MRPVCTGTEVCSEAVRGKMIEARFMAVLSAWSDGVLDLWIVGKAFDPCSAVPNIHYSKLLLLQCVSLVSTLFGTTRCFCGAAILIENGVRRVIEKFFAAIFTFLARNVGYGNGAFGGLKSHRSRDGFYFARGAVGAGREFHNIT